MSSDRWLSLVTALAAWIAAGVNAHAWHLARVHRFRSPLTPVCAYIAGVALVYATGHAAVVAGAWTRAEYFRWFGPGSWLVFLTVWAMPAGALIHALRDRDRRRRG